MDNASSSLTFAIEQAEIRTSDIKALDKAKEMEKKYITRRGVTPKRLDNKTIVYTSTKNFKRWKEEINKA